jgi:hypothetical protein
MYNKIIIYQYGKVSSTNLRVILSGKYIPFIIDSYPYVIQTHSHDVVNDILSKFTEVLIINISRLPIDRNISCFHHSISEMHPDYKNIPFEELFNYFENTNECTINYIDEWMEQFMKTLNLDLKDICGKKNNIISFMKHTNTFIFYKCENSNDTIKYIVEHFIPDYITNISNVCTKYNSASERIDNVYYENFKKNYKINDNIINDIKNSKYINIFYTENEISNHISKYS